MLLRRAGGLLLPYLSWTVIYAAAAGRLLDTGMSGLFSELFGYKSNGLWFFPVLFGLKVMRVLYWIIRSRFNRCVLLIDLSVCVVAGRIIELSSWWKRVLFGK